MLAKREGWGICAYTHIHTHTHKQVLLIRGTVYILRQGLSAICKFIYNALCKFVCEKMYAYMYM